MPTWTLTIWIDGDKLAPLHLPTREMLNQAVKVCEKNQWQFHWVYWLK